MNKATILIFSENKNRTQTLVETFGKTFYSLTANTEEAAIDKFLQSPVDAVLFGEDISETLKAKLTKIFGTQQANTVFVNDNAAVNITEAIRNSISAKQKKTNLLFLLKMMP
ncbi:MAG: hypothetical protein EOP53_05185 [Sphingobacteriales bacterium]|nr:MAG: hypothetical protein EOP53_05185 [Sphingobacteriales bacterium]